MPFHASWVHGNIAVPEIPGPDRFANVDGFGWTDLVGLHRGWGSIFRGKAGTSNVFHFCIPTPVIIGDAPVRLDKAFAFFNVQTPAHVVFFHVWDGPDRRFHREGLTVTGDHSRDIEWNLNAFEIPDKPLIRWGVGISVGVVFEGEASITFTTAGADFRT
jgi:hypothetical protein